MSSFSLFPSKNRSRMSSGIGAEDGMKPNAGRLRNPSPVLVEISSSHQFSADLIGAKPKKKVFSSLLSRLPIRKSRVITQLETSGIAFPDKDPSVNASFNDSVATEGRPPSERGGSEIAQVELGKALDDNTSEVVNLNNRAALPNIRIGGLLSRTTEALLPEVDVVYATPPFGGGHVENFLDATEEFGAIPESLLDAAASRTMPLYIESDGQVFQGEEELSPNMVALMQNHHPLNLTGQVAVDHTNLIDSGGRAHVFSGTLHGEKVAVKVLLFNRTGRPDAIWELSNDRRVKREIDVWAALKHRNICEFLGYTTKAGAYPSMILKWCPYNAGDFLRDHSIPVGDRLRMTLDVSSGLQFLHDLNIVHGDLKPNNILVDGHRVAKLCDFGLVRLVDWEGPPGYTSSSPYTGTSRYKARELYPDPERRGWKPVATLKGDIYSLGCVMLYFVELRIPYYSHKKDDFDLHDAICRYSESPAMRSDSKNELGEMTDYFWNLLEACWGEVSGRPKITVIVETLPSYFPTNT